MEDSDDELFTRAGGGDGLAFTRLVGRHEKRLMAIALRMTGGRASAEDAVQEAFTRAWVQAPRWRLQSNGRAGVGAWLARVLVNIVIDTARKPRSAPLDDIEEPADPATSADEVLIDRERHARLAKAMAALPARQRTAISLTYDAGLSNIEGASAMETSVGAFELLLVRARRTLRDAVANEDAG